MEKNTITELPKIGIEVVGFNKSWIDEDFNTDGTCVCFLTDEGYWIVSMWCNKFDEWLTRYSHEANETLGEKYGGYEYIDAPTQWTEKPTFKTEEEVKEKFTCYEIHTVQARMYGCDNQCDECKDKQNLTTPNK